MNENAVWDAVVIGGGPAGLSAALMLGRARRRVLVVDGGEPRNRFASNIHGALGIEGTPPAELLARGRAECAGYGVEFESGLVRSVVEDGARLHVELESGGIRTARTVVVSTGLADDPPGIPGLRERWGRSILHCPYCHGWEVRDRRLGMLLTDPRGLHLAGLIRQWSDDVTIFGTVTDDAIRRRLTARGVTLVDEPVVEVRGSGDELDAVVTADGTAHAIDALFVVAPPRPIDGFLAALALERTENPFGTFVSVDATGRTSHPRIWAVGNVVDPSANVPMSIGTGSRTGAIVNAFLVEEDTDAALEGWPEVAPDAFWEERYASIDRVWSGNPNASLVDAVAGTTPGRALELGCGEGADAIWLAQQGWTVTALDISPTAIDRARRAAVRAGLSPDVIRFEVADLASWVPSGEYDLVAASFLHSPVTLAREEILRRAATAVAPGGRLVLVSHAAVPPWSTDGHHHVLPTPDDELRALGLPDPAWDVERADLHERAATAPDGTPSTLEDGVVVIRRARS